MSEPTAEARPKKAPGKKYFGLTRNQLLIGGGVFAAALGYIIWKRRKSAASTSTTTAGSPCTAADGTPGTYDGNGNCVSSSDNSQNAALQDELDTLLAGAGAGGSAGAGGGTTGTTGTTGDSGNTGTTGPTGTTGSTTTTASSPTTGTTTSTVGGGGPITVTPVDLHTTQVSATSVQVAWAAPTIPSGQGPLTGYGCEVYTASGQSEGPSWTVPKTQLYANAGGLKSKTTYHLNVWCLPAKSGGPHASVSFTTK